MIEIKKGLSLIGDFIVEQLQNTLIDQGHRATGQLIDTMKHQIKATGSGFEILVFAKGYAKFVDQGIPKGVKVSPFALMEWIEQKGIVTGDAQVKSLAFAIREVIFQKGSPTPGSLQFSKTRKRDEFIKVMLDANTGVIFQMVFDLFAKEVTTTIEDTIRRHKQTFAA